MAAESAGLLMYRRRAGGLEVLLAHPGGPFWTRRDEGAWTIPKGLVEPGEAPAETALREFSEETGLPRPEGDLLPLGTVRQKGGKAVHCWAVEGDCDPATVTSNTFEMEWPPRSGRIRTFPEIDRADFFPLDIAHTKINAAQAAFLDELARQLS